jgi:benzoyl-CoA-dihydrodiol lyase
VLAEKKKTADQASNLVLFDTSPDRYRHWSYEVDGRVAKLTLNVKEDGCIRPGYELKLNSYDLGVDIELYDALQRLRFEHPTVGAVIVTSGKERIFCSGANIYMLGLSSHAWKVNFCKFTNETRNGMEDSSRHSGLHFVAALNGTTAGGGYELALACDEIYLVNDRSSAVSLPEVPLLGVLPGTGGLTRVVDKRKVRRDLADVFCSNADGVRGRRAKEWGLVDDIFAPEVFADRVRERAEALAAKSIRPASAEGVKLTPLKRTIDDAGYHYEYVDVAIDRAGRRATLTVKACPMDAPTDVDGALKAGSSWWPLQMARELDDAILMLRTNDLDIGTWLLKTAGDGAGTLRMDAFLAASKDHWFVRETVGLIRRTLARLDVTSRSLLAIIDENSAFTGTLYELALAADRSYMLDLPDAPEDAPKIALSAMNFGAYPMVNDRTRLATRFNDDGAHLAKLKDQIGETLAAPEALELGLVTFTPDEIDWEDEIRVMLEERASLSPDAMTGLEANLRFPGPETMLSKIFGRLSAWQNWIFIRPNAVGERGALKVYGSGRTAEFNWERV